MWQSVPVAFLAGQARKWSTTVAWRSQNLHLRAEMGRAFAADSLRRCPKTRCSREVYFKSYYFKTTLSRPASVAQRTRESSDPRLSFWGQGSDDLKLNSVRDRLVSYVLGHTSFRRDALFAATDTCYGPCSDRDLAEQSSLLVRIFTLTASRLWLVEWKSTSTKSPTRRELKGSRAL